MSPKKINNSDLAKRIVDSMNEHKIDGEDQIVALCLAFVNACQRKGFSPGIAIDFMITTCNTYDNSDT